MHLRPFVLLVGFVFLHTTPPMTIIPSLCIFFLRVQTLTDHCYIESFYIHTIYGDGLLSLSTCNLKKCKTPFFFFIYLSSVLFSLVRGGFVKCNAANLIPV